MESNFKREDVCRVCLWAGEEMQELFVKENGLVEQIEYCTGLLLVPAPSLPTLICQPCLSRLHTAHAFKTTCLASHNSLHSHTLTNTQTTDDITVKQNMVPVTPITIKVEMQDDVDGGDEGGEGGGALDDDDEWVHKVRKSKRVKKKKEMENGKSPLPGKRGPQKQRRAACSPRAASPVCQEEDKKSELWTSETGCGRGFKVRRVPCGLCAAQFTSKVEARAHRACAHAAPAKPRPKPSRSKLWICEFCGKTFSHQSSHYTHVRSHLPPLHGCPHCAYRTWHRHDLTKHLRIHNGEKNFQCAVCAKSFYNSSNLLSHMRRTHERSRPHACAQCPRRFYDRTKLRRHQDSHDAIKRFECEVCHSCFTRRCYWKKHLQKQHGVVIPPARSGRQKLNFQVGEDLMEAKKDWPALLQDKEPAAVPLPHEAMTQTDEGDAMS